MIKFYSLSWYIAQLQWLIGHAVKWVEPKNLLIRLPIFHCISGCLGWDNVASENCGNGNIAAVTTRLNIEVHTIACTTAVWKHTKWLRLLTHTHAHCSLPLDVSCIRNSFKLFTFYCVLLKFWNVWNSSQHFYYGDSLAEVRERIIECLISISSTIHHILFLHVVNDIINAKFSYQMLEVTTGSNN
jgi:hypothetical protein